MHGTFQLLSPDAVIRTEAVDTVGNADLRFARQGSPRTPYAFARHCTAVCCRRAVAVSGTRLGPLLTAGQYLLVLAPVQPARSSGFAVGGQV
jgi:hypothetical protein